MSNQYLKYGSLGIVLVRFFLLYALLLFLTTLIGHGIYAFFSGNAFNYDSLASSLLFAVVVSCIITFIYRSMLKDIFRFLTNDNIEVPQNRNMSKIVMASKSFQLNNLIATLEQMGMGITYVNRDEQLLKIRQKLIFLNGCGATLYYNNTSEELTLISFSLFENTLNDYSSQVNQFSQKLFNNLSL